MVANAACLRMGWALVSPATAAAGSARRRSAPPSNRAGTRRLVLAGLVEVSSRRGLGLGPVIVVGVTLGAVYWALVL
jgi:hypothetical protein